MLLIVAAIVSIIVQFIKQKVTTEWETLLILIVISLAGAGVYTALVDFGYWEAFYGVLVTASAFYTLILARFEGGSDVSTFTPSQAPDA
jgi:hypothetical protein